jgi:hypothetical protein
VQSRQSQPQLRGSRQKSSDIQPLHRPQVGEGCRDDSKDFSCSDSADQQKSCSEAKRTIVRNLAEEFSAVWGQGELWDWNTVEAEMSRKGNQLWFANSMGRAL